MDVLHVVHGCQGAGGNDDGLRGGSGAVVTAQKDGRRGGAAEESDGDDVARGARESKRAVASEKARNRHPFLVPLPATRHRSDIS